MENDCAGKRSRLDQTCRDGHPEGGLFRTRTWAIRPRLSEDAGLLWLLDHREGQEGREEAVRAYGKQIEEAIKGSPDVLAPLRLHYLRWVLFDVGSGLHFQYQGIFDTDFDKYTEDAVQLFSRPASRPYSPISKDFRRIGRRTQRHSSNSSGSTRCPASSSTANTLRNRRRDQEGAAAEGGLLGHARPDAVNRARCAIDA